MSAAESKAILEKDAEVEGYLVYLMGIPSYGAGTTIAMSGKPGELFNVLLEAYAGHGPISVGEGPQRYGGRLGAKEAEVDSQSIFF